MRNWRNITYLLDGTERQQAAFRAMRYVGIETLLADFDPLLVGTIPLDIDIASSDLDILLEIPDEFQYAQVLFPHFAHHTNFRYRSKTIGNEQVWMTNFYAHGFEFELFAQQKPTEQQNAYKHMIVEYRLLELGGDSVREAIRALKQQGLKTEPAFAEYFDFQNDDPYSALLALADMDDAALQHLLKQHE